MSVSCQTQTSHQIVYANAQSPFGRFRLDDCFIYCDPAMIWLGSPRVRVPFVPRGVPLLPGVPRNRGVRLPRALRAYCLSQFQQVSFAGSRIAKGRAATSAVSVRAVAAQRVRLVTSPSQWNYLAVPVVVPVPVPVVVPVRRTSRRSCRPARRTSRRSCRPARRS